ncbi:DUF5082 domain-containing protein [Bacillus hwajinpoensis]|uniref:DUF5082 domain-containing protein n=1 Tax=Guptibacillus hwajinpoensis TaxID=208199 RepID=A0A845F0X3_9BACL|nr:DUF5082 family protein [Pseudalkalibacillus hwajinpoensis]MYL64451.1 DUF5082 domain-containing protein [Pseudalkalibacillus hwajinpoensis]
MSYLSYLQSEIAEKRAQLVRLQSSIVKLDGLQTEFIQNKQFVEQPELTPTTWAGELANSFQNIREDMKASYQDLSINQVNSALNTMENKADHLRREIQTLEFNITQEIHRLEEEARERRNAK